MSDSLENLNKTVCYRTTLNFTEAVSPAFVIKDYDWASNKYSSWSESTWKPDSIYGRIFLKPSSAHENMTIAVGSIVLVFSFALVYFVKNRSHILFAPAIEV